MTNQRYMCECGSDIKLSGKSKHFKSKKHLTFLGLDVPVPVVKAKHQCECGSFVVNMKSHVKTKKHQKFIGEEVNVVASIVEEVQENVSVAEEEKVEIVVASVVEEEEVQDVSVTEEEKVDVAFEIVVASVVEQEEEDALPDTTPVLIRRKRKLTKLSDINNY